MPFPKQTVAPTDGDIIRRWRASILAFIEDVWKLTPQPLKKGVSDSEPAEFYRPQHFQPFQKGKHLTWQQWLFFREIDLALKAGENVFLSVASGHGTGKSTDESIVILWGLTCWLDSNIGCTAPTADQMYDVLWKEVARWHRKMPPALADCFEIQQAYVRVRERPETWWARARTARKEAPEALAGLHAEVIVILVDEASGVPEEIFEVAQGALTGKLVIFIMVSNPTRLSGFFHASHHKNRANWRRLRFNSEESPIVDPEYPKRIAEQYGKDSPQYKVRVLGQFPDSEEDQLIPQSLFDAAAARPRTRDYGYCRSLGVDVARYGGDRTALMDRQGFVMEVRKVRRDQDTVATANDVMEELRIAKREDNPYDFIMVDVIGLGAGVYDTLKERQRSGLIDQSVTILAVNVSESADNEDEHHNLRAELWYGYRDWLKTGAVDPQLREESCAVKYAKPDSKGRNVIEPKEDTRERLGSSPDLADAGIITLVVGPQRRESKPRPMVKLPPANGPWWTSGKNRRSVPYR